jgi:uncharacterized protein Yka (UPF0111/DUF47 family)
MAQEKKIGWLAGLYEPTTDFYILLSAHAEKTLAGMEALKEWISQGAKGRCESVRNLEKEADKLKQDLSRKLVDTFVTPFDREDIYDLSAQLDEVINSAKKTVREIEALELTAIDPFLIEMSEILIEGTRSLCESFKHLNSNITEASEQANLARRADSHIFKCYRTAIRELFLQDDLKNILKVREVYKCMMHSGETIDRVAEKLLHVVIKIC